ncbi:MAG: protein translocase subunit SecD [Ruminococcaceae bacterium]|nr:protein translocase subunit SecD [Oscillospiraceae bacterium]
MKKKSGRTGFFAVVLIIAVLTWLSFCGLRSPDGTVIVRGAGDIRWGVDISGGVSVTFRPVDSVSEEVTTEQMRTAAQIIGMRFEDYNVSGYEIFTDTENSRLTVSFPWSEEDGDVDRLVGQLSATAHISAIEGRTGGLPVVATYIDDHEHAIAVDASGGKHRVAVESSNIESAQRVRDKDGNAAVQLNFTDEGRQLFLESTGRLTAFSEYSGERYITFCIDGKPISELHVGGAMSQGIMSPSEGMSEEDAGALVSLINNGELSFSLERMDYERIDAALGGRSVTVLLIAGIVAFAIICLFMIVRYRLPGAVGCIALLGQAAGILACVSGFFPFADGITLTLPGVAGIVLSIGMGVDANIITGERIAEEVRKGKSIEGAISAGCSGSFSSIFDGNITVIIVSVILMGVFGPPDTLWSLLLRPVTWMFPISTTGSIYAFGCILLAGVIFNFIMGVTASRVMLRSLSAFRFLRGRKLYGGGE